MDKPFKISKISKIVITLVYRDILNVFMVWLNVSNVSVYFTCKTGKKRSILYEKLCMKVYLDDEKTHVDPCPHNGHSVVWTVMTETIVITITFVWPFPNWEFSQKMTNKMENELKMCRWN